MIRTEGLTKVFRVGFWGRKVTALSDLNLEVNEKEIFGFLGPNGAGKTTTLKLLMGLIYPTSGRAWLFGRDLSNVTIKKDVGFLPEAPYFYDYLTAYEFLRFYGELFEIEKGLLKSRIETLLDMVGLSDNRGLPLRKFSKGMLQRIGIAQALVNDPKLVILDEPMSGLDPIGRREIRDIILKLKGDGKTVFFSSHILSDAEMICDRVGILNKGRLLNVGRLNEILEARIRYIEVIVEGIGEEAVLKIEDGLEKAVRVGERIIMRLGNEKQVDDIIELIRRKGGRIISIIPQRESLEDYFIKEVGIN